METFSTAHPCAKTSYKPSRFFFGCLLAGSLGASFTFSGNSLRGIGLIFWGV